MSLYHVWRFPEQKAWPNFPQNPKYNVRDGVLWTGAFAGPCEVWGGKKKKREKINICVVEGDRRFDGITLSLFGQTGSCPDTEAELLRRRAERLLAQFILERRWD